MPLFEIETVSHIIITWADDEQAAREVVQENYPREPPAPRDPPPPGYLGHIRSRPWASPATAIPALPRATAWPRPPATRYTPFGSTCSTRAPTWSAPARPSSRTWSWGGDARQPYEGRNRLASWPGTASSTCWRFGTGLTRQRRESLARRSAAIDFELARSGSIDGGTSTANIRDLADRAGPPPAFRSGAAANRFTPDEARERGRAGPRAGEVGAMLVAGGQGTRLGFDHPKGMFPIGPVSGRTLFQIHVEKILAAARRHGVRIPLYLMTSPATHEETVGLLRPARPLRTAGRRPEDLLPGDDAGGGRGQGRLLLEAPGRLAPSPDGHGGMLAALAASGCLADARQPRIRQLFYFQVDNPLVDICGAEFSAITSSAARR